MTPDPRYGLTIYWSADDEVYLAEVPELPGCIADGATYAEALVAVEAWIETAREIGREIPRPRTRPHVV